jgi:hypothetical protein
LSDKPYHGATRNLGIPSKAGDKLGWSRFSRKHTPTPLTHTQVRNAKSGNGPTRNLCRLEIVFERQPEFTRFSTKKTILCDPICFSSLLAFALSFSMLYPHRSLTQSAAECWHYSICVFDHLSSRNESSVRKARRVRASHKSVVGLSGFWGSEGVKNAKYAQFAHILSGTRQA